MKSKPDLKFAKLRGEAIAESHSAGTLPIDPFKIAKSNEIHVQAKPHTDPGVSGMLMRHGNKFGIMYATHIDNDGFQRFSVAHELGHYFLDGHMDHILPIDGIHESQAGFTSSNPYEMEADSFAAGLLMPSSLFTNKMTIQKPGLVAIKKLADTCMTSWTSTAIRFVELTEDAVAIVVSSGKKIEYCCLSATMKSLPGINWPRKGQFLPKDTATVAFNLNSSRRKDNKKDYDEINIQDWFGGEKSVDAEEEVISLGSYGKTLTVLTCPSLVDETYEDEDVESDEAMDERWTPHF